MKTWDEIKSGGSEHYKNGGIEPIDLYRSIGILRSFAIASICKYAVRNAGNGLPTDNPVKVKDMEKIIHYANILMTAYGDSYGDVNANQT